MSLYRIQGKAEIKKGIYYEFNSDEEPLGIGGMGKVFQGRCVNESTGTAKDVAVKFMYDGSPDHVIERARREASIQIRHDNLVEMLGFIETEEKGVLGETKHHYHVVSELLNGVVLDDLLQGKLTDRHGNIVPFAQKLYDDYQKDSYHFAVYVIRNILSGLMALHDAGYIHRDIDPTNVMVTSDGHIKLIDFGIAKQMHSLTTHDKSLTVAGVFMGKPEYAAPELVLGDIKSQDQTTDIYAVGILFFQCIVGHVPFEGDRHEVLSMQLHNNIPLRLIKSTGIKKIIAKATNKTRAKRYQSAAEFRVDIDRLPQSLSISNFVWKRSYTIASACIALCVVAILIFYPHATPSPNSKSERVVNDKYQSVVSSLSNSEKAEKGLIQLDGLSKAGNSEATFLLSRLYFKSEAAQDVCPDSIKRMQDFTKIGTDNARAHNLLIQAIQQDGNNYQALYELACDYLGGSNRAAGYNRDLSQAISLFERAKEIASKANDTDYTNRIQSHLQVLKER